MAKSTETLYRHGRILELVPTLPASTTAPALWVRLRDEGFTCTKRTVERDLELLSGRYPLVADDSDKPFRWSYTRQAQQRLVPALTPSQAVALALAREHLGHLLPKALAESLAPLYRTADAVIEELGWKRWVDATAFVAPTQRLVPAAYNPQTLFTIQQAIAKNQQLTIRYRKKWDEEAKQRVVHPLGVLFGGPVSYLVATDVAGEQPKQFALHRIASAHEMDAKRITPKGFRIKRYANSHEAKWLHEANIQLVLWIDPPAAEHLRETPLSEDQTWRRLENPDVVEMTATVDDTEQLRWWLLGFGGQVKIKEPMSLRRVIDQSMADRGN